MTELFFLAHTCIIAIASLVALALGKSALVAFICTQCILANLFVIKQTMLFGFTATCADAFTVGATLGLNLLQEYFGKKEAKKAIWTNFFLLLFYVIVSQVHLLYTPIPYDATQTHFTEILQFMPRIVVASFIVYFLAQMLDYYLYGMFKKICQNRYLIIRNYASIIICQLFDTVLFSFLGLYGIVEDITSIIMVSYSIKLISIVFATPFVALSRFIYQKSHHHS